MPRPLRAARRRFLPALLLALLAPPVGQAQSATAPPYRVTGVQVKLFYENTGTFSPDILADPKFDLWNTGVGEGSAKGPSSSTLVVVTVAGEAGSYEPARKVELTARFVSTDGKTTTLRRREVQVYPMGIVTTQGRFYAAFWLTRTGCIPVELSIRILGQPAGTTARRKIPFACGE